MLQAPSHLSRACGHSHIKKFWLTQTQNESQACENKSGLHPACPRHVCGSSSKGAADCKQSSMRNSAVSGVKNLQAGVSPSGRPALPIASGPVVVSNGDGGASPTVRRVSLGSCAECLVPPYSSDHAYGSRQSSLPDAANSNVEVEDNGPDGAEELDCSCLKVPVIEDVSASSSRCGSPFVDLASRPDGQDIVVNFCDNTQSAKSYYTKASVVSQPATDGGYALSSCQHSRAFDDGAIRASKERRVDDIKYVDNYCSDSHSEELENSESGTDAGDSDHAINPVRCQRTGACSMNGRFIEKRSDISSSTPSVPALKGRSEKRNRVPGACTEGPSCNHRDSSPEIGNAPHNGALRVCTLCGTSKTPLWRSGPHGPKSLCNACGIRFKKSRRFAGYTEVPDLLASPSGSSGGTRHSYVPLKRKPGASVPCEASTPRASVVDTVLTESSLQLQKRSKWPDLVGKKPAPGHVAELAGSSAESCLTWNLLPSSSKATCVRKLDTHSRLELDLEGLHTADAIVGRATWNEEEEAALLLMHLSYGFVYA